MRIEKRGKYYELKACEYLKLKGYRILTTNFRTKGSEIDIIAKDKGYIVFVEVKGRRKGSLVSGFEAVDRSKQKKIERGAKIYSQTNPDASYRFDVLNIEEGENFRKYDLIKGAFYLDEEGRT